jgi:predicted transcriptional regulator
MSKKITEPRSREYIDSNGEKWVQTSPDDLFAIKELNEVFEAIEKDKKSGEIVLARIDFRTVNKEYYDTIQDLQTRLKRKEELLKRLTAETKRVLKRKNDMMYDMIAYIRQLQLLVAQKSLSPDLLKGVRIDSIFGKPIVIEEEREEEAAVFEQVEEITLDDDGQEVGA